MATRGFMLLATLAMLASIDRISCQSDSFTKVLASLIQANDKMVSNMVDFKNNINQFENVQKYIQSVKDVQKRAEEFMNIKSFVDPQPKVDVQMLKTAVSSDKTAVQKLIVSYTLMKYNEVRMGKVLDELNQNVAAFLNDPKAGELYTTPLASTCQSVEPNSYGLFHDLKEISITRVCKDIQTCPPMGTHIYTDKGGQVVLSVEKEAFKRVKEAEEKMYALRNRFHSEPWNQLQIFRLLKAAMNEHSRLKEELKNKKAQAVLSFSEQPLSETCSENNKCNVIKALPMMTAIFWYEINEMVLHRLCPQTFPGKDSDYQRTFQHAIEDGNRLTSFAASLSSYWMSTWTNFYTDAISMNAFTNLETALSMLEEKEEDFKITVTMCHVIKFDQACTSKYLLQQYNLIKKVQQTRIQDTKVKDLQKYSQVDHAALITLQKQNLQHVELLGSIKKLDDNLQASVSGISTFFQGLAKFDEGIASNDVTFIKGELAKYETNLLKVQNRLNQDIGEAMKLMSAVVAANLAEEITKMAVLIATNSNPLKLIFSSPDLKDIIDQAGAIANAATEYTKGIALLVSLKELQEDSQELRRAFGGNADQITSLETIANKIKKGQTNDISEDSDEFLKGYGSYTPKTDQATLAKNDALWSAFKDAICDILNGDVGVGGAIPKAIAGGKLLCERLEGTLAQFFTIRGEIYDFQFELVDKIAAVVRGDIAKRFAMNIKGKHDVLEASQFLTGFLMMQSKVQTVSAAYCDVLEYKNHGQPVSACATNNGLFGKRNIDALASYADNIPYQEVDQWLYLPTRSQVKGDSSVVDLPALARGETVDFQIPMNRTWLEHYGWILPRQNTIPFIKSFKLFLPHKQYDRSVGFTTTQVTVTSIHGSSVSPVNTNHRKIYILPKGHGTYTTIYQEGYPTCSSEIENPYSLCGNLPKICDTTRMVSKAKSLMPTILSRWRIQAAIHQGSSKLEYDAPSTDTNLLLRAKVVLIMKANSRKKDQIPNVHPRSDVVKSTDGCCEGNRYRTSQFNYDCASCPDATVSNLGGLYCQI